MRHAAMLLALLVCTLAAPTRAAPTFPDRGRRSVVDEAHLLSDADRAALDQRILSFVQATGHQLVIVTLPDLQGEDVKDYGYQLGRHLGLGDRDRNDGAILLLSVNPRKVRIEVGYGLEPVLTDALTSMILQSRIVPRLKQGDTIGALREGADAIMQATGYTPPDADPDGGLGVMQAGAAAEEARSSGAKTEAFLVIGAFVGFFVFIIAVILLVSRIGRRRGWTGGTGGSSASSSSSDASSDSSSSSDSGFDSGGGSFGGGGSDSDY